MAFLLLHNYTDFIPFTNIKNNIIKSLNKSYFATIDIYINVLYLIYKIHIHLYILNFELYCQLYIDLKK
ncbi:hypothetical protein M6K068_2398 [Staphylococcus aureus]|nr:hypothetical protein M6K068_2398 [Staphylococcus aureus]